MKTKHAAIISAVFVAVVACIFIAVSYNGQQFNRAKREILLRQIGHEILLHDRDSTSRVLPVEHIDGETYQLRFEREFSFKPDSLVSIVHKSLAQNPQQPDYIVRVLDCAGKSVVYGYMVSSKGQNNVIPCSGRQQSKGCYIVRIAFDDSTLLGSKTTVPLFAIVLLCPLLALGYFKKSRRKFTASNHSIAIGTFVFNADKKCLVRAEETTSLTSKEAKLLAIFAQNPNVVIDRARLQKEIWEDNGVIVGRSLDVFISKLRKKLEADASVQLVNIHGKGYKLQTIEAEA